MERIKAVERKAKSFKLALRDNNLMKQDICGICGTGFKPAHGPALFLAHYTNPVCDKCGKKHSPELYRLLEIHRLFSDDIWRGRLGLK